MPAPGWMRKNRKDPKMITGCKAYIVLRISENKDCLLITGCHLTHNHVQCPIEFNYYFKKGYLLANSCLPVRTTNKISKQFISGEEVKRLLSYCKNRDNGVLETLHSLDALFTNDPGAKVKFVFMEDQVVIKTIFFLTSVMRSLCQRNPFTLIFDRMVHVNEDFDLYTVLCIDSKGQGRECAYCLTRKMPDLLRFTLVSLVQSVPDIKPNVTCLILGVAVEDKAVVRDLLPYAKVQICHSQVERLLLLKAQEMGSTEVEKIWPFFVELTSATSQNAYNQAVRSMDGMLPKAFMTYFREHWHPCHEMWVQLWAPKNTMKVDCGELITEHQQKLEVALKSSSTVAQCILDLVLIHYPKGENESLTEDEVAARYHAICKLEPASLIEEELGFARPGTYTITETKEGFTLNDGISEFFMDHSLTSCNCTIHTSSLLPCRHLFATRLQNKIPLFDMQLLKKNMTVLLKSH
ncbi:uncharacterized protein ZSWIM9-like isoform X2 [Pleurodeles waltl]|uniref:uncharacterized protein ZSWIM9-like isoform X2 n=1 Tax=Pleurodeles waltl TaxID=8319 RepID=UPI003709A2DD